MEDNCIEVANDAFIISETDEKGIITYANADFCKYSGYKIEELIGKPHNIVRHPDMPKAAFKDLWQTISAGNVWEGFVKNRAKDGKAYWVFSTVIPCFTLSGIPGYMSCRRKPSPEEIIYYSQLYKTME